MHQSGDGSGFASHMAQSMEHWVKLMKRHLRNHCNSLDGWRERLMKFLDCYTVGSVGYDLIDFKYCSEHYNKCKELLYNPMTTPMLESNILLGMPDNFFNFYTKVNKIQFGDPIPSELSRIWNQHLRSNQQYNAMSMYVNDIDAFEMLDDTSSWDGSVDGSLNQELAMNPRLSKVELLRLMQQREQSIAS